MKMRLGQLREMLAGIPDDADLIFVLDADSRTMTPTFLRVPQQDDPPNLAQLRTVVLSESADESSTFPEQVRLGLPAEFVSLCDNYDVEPAEVLHGFIADLCDLRSEAGSQRPDGLASSGSDAVDMAWRYFERRGYGEPARDDEAAFSAPNRRSQT